MAELTSVTASQTTAAAADFNKVIVGLTQGWMACDPWIYTSATSFTISGVDRTSLYTVGWKLKWDQTTTKYAYVISSALVGSDTVVTINGGNTYAVTNATISNNYRSCMSNPVGFPDSLDYTPTGVSAANATLTGRFHVSGRRCTFQIHAAFTGAITFTTMPTLPITAAAGLTTYDDGDADLAQVGGAAYFDSGTATVIGTLFPNVPSAATVCTITTSAGADISASAPITWANGDALSVWGTYEI